MKAIILQGEPGKVVFVEDRSLPKLRPGYIGVEVKAVALNPADWKHIDRPFLNTKDCLLGCDYAGVVSRLGQGYEKQWKVGDRICGFVHGGNQYHTEDGAYAEQIIVNADVQMRIPEEMSFENAAAFGVSVVTCGQGMFQQMGLDYSNSGGNKTILIYGGSTATGALGIQFARLAGYCPITICSARNFQLVKDLGAVAAFDYNEPDCIERIKEFSTNIPYVWDTVGTAGSAELGAEVISSGGVYGSIVGVELPRGDVRVTFSLGYTVFGEPVSKGPSQFPDTRDDFKFGKSWIRYAEGLLHGGHLVTVPIKPEYGLENVLVGINQLRNGKVSGRKLVYQLG